MGESTTSANHEQETADLKALVLRLIRAVFESSSSPKLTEAEVENAVDVLFDLLQHRVGDPNLDGIGTQILESLRRRNHNQHPIKIADSFEPFAKFVLRVAFPDQYRSLEAKHRHRFTLPEVLKELKLADESELQAWSRCPWQRFTPPELPGKPDFKEQVAWTVRFRNTQGHQAPDLDDVREATLFQSVCVCLVWLTAKYEPAIRLALTRSRFSNYLQQVQDRFKDIATRFIELTTEARSSDEYRFLDPLAPQSAAASGEQSDASKLIDTHRIVVIEAEPGAGKTTTLRSIAWQQADGLLQARSDHTQIPVYVELKLAFHHSQTIETAVHRELQSFVANPEQIPWNSLLLLLDGVNEVSSEFQSRFKAEVRELLSRFSKLRLIIAGRPNSFPGEFEARVFVLHPLTTDQLLDLFQRILGDGDKARALLASVKQNSFLSSWVRIPLHAAMVVSMAKQKGIAALTSPSTTVRRFVRGFLNRERVQAPGQTLMLPKERLLARLAFETKSIGRLAFSKALALSVLRNAKDQIAATSLDVPKFLHEVLDNHLLHYADAETIEFAHEFYHDYFAATELETREQSQPGSGIKFALDHFSKAHWKECIRLFAGFSNSSQMLIKHGSEGNPFLAWQLLRDASVEAQELVGRVSDEAYCALSKELKSPAQVGMAIACIFVLADLERADLLEQAVTEQRETFKPKSDHSTEEAAAAALIKQQQVTVPLFQGLLLLVQRGLREQRLGQEGRFFQAAQSAIRGLERIKAARVLCAMLDAWTGSDFVESDLIPGTVLNALINLGVDKVLDEDIESINQALVTWLKRASESGLSKAWPAYGRVLRLVRHGYFAGTGLDEFDDRIALDWLRKAHEAGNSKGTLELALLLVEEPGLTSETGEGERMLRHMAITSLEARFELGSRLWQNGHLPKNEAEGLEHLLLAAEGGHDEAIYKIMHWWGGLCPPPKQLIDPDLPAWAVPYKDRLLAVLLGNHFNER